MLPCSRFLFSFFFLHTYLLGTTLIMNRVCLSECPASHIAATVWHESPPGASLGQFLLASNLHGLFTLSSWLIIWGCEHEEESFCSHFLCLVFVLLFYAISIAMLSAIMFLMCLRLHQERRDKYNWAFSFLAAAYSRCCLSNKLLSVTIEIVSVLPSHCSPLREVLYRVIAL